MDCFQTLVSNSTCIKPKPKPPRIKRLKLEYDGLLSNFAFKLNLRRYTKASFDSKPVELVVSTFQAGAYTPPPFSSTQALFMG
jgi:hypothetical protein